MGLAFVLMLALKDASYSSSAICRQRARNLDLGDEIPRHVYLHQLSRKWLEHRFVARQLQDEREMEHWYIRILLLCLSWY